MEQPILVGDIGSTKSTWWYGTGTETGQELCLKGYNPMAHSQSTGNELFKSLRDHTGDVSFSAIWYYGAGVIGHEVSHAIRLGLTPFFPGSKIHVLSDLAGACAAACGDTPGTVAILGTGSHAAVWDGHKISRQATSLGYILGDEGGGCDIGKAMIQAYFYHEMPEPIIIAMGERIPSGRQGFLSALQTSQAPNQYLADFARLAVLFQEHHWVRELVAARFDVFIKKHILPLEPIGDIHVVGSIGCIFARLMRLEMAKNGLSAGTFIKDPAHRLFERHHEHGKK